jgi:hypothetical protein
MVAPPWEHTLRPRPDDAPWPREDCVHAHLMSATPRVDRHPYVWLAIALELLTAIPAILVGIQLVTDASGASVGFPAGWIEATPFGSYLLPGLYLLLMNGLGMIVLAGLSAMRHWTAPWLTGVLGTGLVIWILVQLVIMPEFSFLQAIFGGVGIVLVAISTVWLRATDQLRLW